MGPLLEARNLCKAFGAVTAADDISVAVAEREVIGIIGANGAGKTTFVNMVTGYLRPDAGSIRYQGRDITRLAPRAIARAGICRSFQIPQTFARLTVLENMLVALNVAKGRGLSWWRPAHDADLDADARALLSGFAMLAYLDQRAGTLPQGVRKLLDIAMAMVSEPRVMLLDEPTSGISTDEKHAAMDTLIKVLGERGVTILFVEHDMEIVERYANRVMAFYDGRIIADGAPNQVLADADVRKYVVGGELHRRHSRAGVA
jgi:branched-chain amino acid transport system ATP-binding protein